MGRVVFVFWICAATLLGTVPAHAQARRLEEGAPPAAESRYQIAIQLYREGRFKDAAAEFEAALAMFPTSAKLAYNLARTKERAEDPTGAIAAYRRYLMLAPTAEDADEVRSLIALLESRLDANRARLSLTSQPSGAAVYVDDARTASGRTPLEIRVEPGRHTLRFELPNRPPVERAIEPAPGQAISLTVKVPQPTGPSAGGTEPVVRRVAGEDGVDWKSIGGWTAVGLGVGGLALGAVYLAETHSIADDAAGTRGNERDALEDDFNSAQTLAVVGFAAGGALVATGVTLLLWPEGDAAVAAGPGQLALWGRF